MSNLIKYSILLFDSIRENSGISFPQILQTKVEKLSFAKVTSPVLLRFTLLTMESTISIRHAHGIESEKFGKKFSPDTVSVKGHCIKSIVLRDAH